MFEKLEHIYRKEQKNLFRFIHSRTGDIEEAEDILQELFLNAAENLNIAEPINNLLGWLYTAARNRVIDWYRKKKNVVSIHTPVRDTTLENLIEDIGLPVEKDFIRRLVLDMLIEKINELPDNQREVIIQQTIKGNTFKEISRETGIGINTLIARKRYALQNLKEKLLKIKELIDEMEY
ncbi:MAG: sigma-70 family RNA polymerase sigma factor [Spirochaetales bacterium]|nr:sigma-70 family RNA polymerase sigma factor [Spirochaetales bacterium]